MWRWPRAPVHGAGMRFFLLAVISCALCACSTVATKPQMEMPGYMQVLKAKKVDPATYARIATGRVLGYGDIKNLVAKGIPGKMIVPYLKATRTPYRYSAKEINGLVNAGADDVLVNYLGKAAGVYMQDSGDIPSSGSWKSHPYFADPDYMGPAPFDFAYPDAWAGNFIGLY